MDINKINDIIKNYKDKPNKELLNLMEILITEFNKTKELIIDLTKHLENIEDVYNEVQKEYKIRIKK